MTPAVGGTAVAPTGVVRAVPPGAQGAPIATGTIAVIERPAGSPGPPIPQDEGWMARRRRLGVPRSVTFRVFLFVLLLIGVVVAAYAVVRWYATDNYYVTVDNQNRLVIYQGRPGGLMGFNPKVVETTDVTTATVRTDQLANLKANVEEPTLAAARQYIRNLQSAYAAQQLLLHPPPTTTVPTTVPHQRRPRKHRRAARPSSPEPRRPLRHPPRPRPQRPRRRPQPPHERPTSRSQAWKARLDGSAHPVARHRAHRPLRCGALPAGQYPIPQGGALASDPKNPRNASLKFDNQRGQILASDGTVLAQSVPATSGSYKYQRVYPQGSLYSQLVGYDSSIYGTNGIEDQYNDYLVAHTQPAQSLAQLLSPPPKTTDDVTLTINPTLQKTAQEALASASGVNKDGAIVALDPQTGAVLAMYSNPTYDPNPLASPSSTIQTEARLAYLAKDAEGFSPSLPIATAAIFPRARRSRSSPPPRSTTSNRSSRTSRHRCSPARAAPVQPEAL